MKEKYPCWSKETVKENEELSAKEILLEGIDKILIKEMNDKVDKIVLENIRFRHRWKQNENIKY